MAIKTNYGSVTDWLSNKEFTPIVTPNDIKNSRTAELQGLEAGDLYGIEYDAGAIEGIYNRATDAQYALKQKEYQAAENQYYRNMYASQNSAIDALRAQRADQIATGMSAGLAAAAESATAMGLQDTNAAGALELANQRQMMADEIAAAYAENIVKAFETSQSTKQAVAGLDLDKFKTDTEWDLGAIAAYTMMNETAGNVHAAQLGEYSTIAQGLIGAQAEYDAAIQAARAQIESAKLYNPTSPNDPNLLTTEEHLKQYTKSDGTFDYQTYANDLRNNNLDETKVQGAVADQKNKYLKEVGLSVNADGTQTEEYKLWKNALDGDDAAMAALGIDTSGITVKFRNDKSIEYALNNAIKAISEGKHPELSNPAYLERVYKANPDIYGTKIPTTKELLYNYIESGVFGGLTSGL